MEEIPAAVALGAAADRDGLTARVSKLIGRLHHEGFSHRDLKESNLLIDEQGEPHLIDLDGLSFEEKVASKVAVANLVRLDRGLRGRQVYTRANWIGFIKRYCRETGLRPANLRTRNFE
jgi:tRNA A-37 threonylcarbamoyl transferase component Bud32